MNSSYLKNGDLSSKLKKYYKLIAKESTVKEKCKEAHVCEKNLKKEKSS